MTATEEPAEAREVPPKGASPIRRLTQVVLIVLAAYFILYVLADRWTPYTDQARVQSLVTPIVPRVTGYLTEVDVRLHSVVEAGDRMFVIDPRPYGIALQKAEANVDLAAQQIGAQSQTVKSAAAQLGVARAQLDRAQRNYSRTQSILENNPGALSQADKDRAETALDQALERVASAEASLQRAREQLGAEGEDNAQLRNALAALEQAQLDLAFTEIVAPSRGVIESFNVAVGYYTQPGQPIATFVSHGDEWIAADLTENNLGNVDVGDPVEFILDVVPGQVFRGSVRSVGAGVSSGGATSRGELPSVKNSTGWLRDPQRFPVIVAIDASAVASAQLRPGAQATVVVYTGGNFLLNGLAKLRIRVASWLSYVR